MNQCQQISRQALMLVALARGERELKEAWAHARSCAGCARQLHLAERMLVMVDAELAPSPASAVALLRAKKAVDLELNRRPAPSPWAARAAAAAATIGAAAALAGPLARHRHHVDAESVVLGSAAAVTAATLAWLGVGSRLAAAALAACAASLAVAAVSCWPLAALAATGGLSPSTSRWSTAALAAAGALAGQAALHLACPERSAAPHLLAFHVGGVMLAALAGWAVPRALRAIA